MSLLATSLFFFIRIDEAKIFILLFDLISNVFLDGIMLFIWCNFVVLYGK